jgi:uncharacterized protein (TIGR02001 family)
LVVFYAPLRGVLRFSGTLWGLAMPQKCRSRAELQGSALHWHAFCKVQDKFFTGLCSFHFQQVTTGFLGVVPMKLSKLSSALLAGGLLFSAASAQAADEAAGAFTTTGSVLMTTDYFYRGITQSDSAALQGNLMVSHESGLYLNVWGSSVSALVPASGLELDPSIGFAGKAGDVSYDVGVLYYGYPNSSATEAAVPAGQSDFAEVYGSVAFSGAKFGLAYAPDFFGETGKSLYLNASYGMEVGGGFAVSAYVGYSLLDDEYYGDNMLLGTDKYLDYKVAVTKGVLGLTTELAVIGTDLDDDDADAVFSVSKAF